MKLLDDEGSGFIVSIYVWSSDGTKADAKAEIERLAPQFVSDIESIEKVDY